MRRPPARTAVGTVIPTSIPTACHHSFELDIDLSDLERDTPGRPRVEAAPGALDPWLTRPAVRALNLRGPN